MNLAQYVASRSADGRYCFTTDEAAQALSVSRAAVYAALRRLRKKGEVTSPHHGFWVIVPPEYRRLGCLPPDQFVPQLMEYLREPYYVALLSAAELHGAAHQRPQTFQVMVRTNRRPLACGKVRVEFVARKDMDRSAVLSRKTPRGLIRVASPEVTAFELVGYPEHCGGLDNVATVLGELVEAMELGKLRAEAENVPIAWVQRAGYLLACADRSNAALVLEPFIRERAKVVAPLIRSASNNGAPRDERWKLIVNADVEPDL